MLCEKDIELFLNEPVKLVKKGGFVLYGYIRNISEDSLIFEAKGVKSIIIFDVIEEIVQRKGRRGFDY